MLEQPCDQIRVLRLNRPARLNAFTREGNEGGMSWRCGQVYRQDLRDRVLAAQGTVREVAQYDAVSQSFVSRECSRQRRLGHAPFTQRSTSTLVCAL